MSDTERERRSGITEGRYSEIRSEDDVMNGASLPSGTPEQACDSGLPLLTREQHLERTIEQMSREAIERAQAYDSEVGFLQRRCLELTLKLEAPASPPSPTTPAPDLPSCDDGRGGCTERRANGTCCRHPVTTPAPRQLTHADVEFSYTTREPKPVDPRFIAILRDRKAELTMADREYVDHIKADGTAVCKKHGDVPPTTPAPEKPLCIDCREPYAAHSEPYRECPRPFGGFLQESRYRAAPTTPAPRCKACNDEGVIHSHEGDILGPCDCARSRPAAPSETPLHFCGDPSCNACPHVARPAAPLGGEPVVSATDLGWTKNDQERQQAAAEENVFRGAPETAPLRTKFFAALRNYEHVALALDVLGATELGDAERMVVAAFEAALAGRPAEGPGGEKTFFAFALCAICGHREGAAIHQGADVKIAHAFALAPTTEVKDG